METVIQKTLRTQLEITHGHVGGTSFTLLDMACAELEKAVRKHPLFPQQLMDRYHEVNLRGMLNVSRSRCDDPHTVTAYDVINEEYFEFLEAILMKNREEALKELAQTIAMLLRVGLHLDHYLGTEDHREQCGETLSSPT